VTCKILILGGYGVFGGRLARALIKDARFDVVVAGRDERAARAFCAEHGGRVCVLDRDNLALAAEFAAESPTIVVDAAGPFQTYGNDTFKVAAAAIACGAHYLDLSDDADFTVGIAGLDAAAKARGVAVLSGVSTVPALSSSVVNALTRDLSPIHLIESAVLPGNRAPRGLSVVRAIVGQAGRPLQLWRDGAAYPVPGWSGLTALDLEIPGTKPLRARWASFIGAPDLKLFAQRYGTKSVLFRAGLELKLMHGGLSLLSGLVSAGLVRTLAPVALPLKWMADRLEPFGSDRGGMCVRVIGQTPNGRFEQRDWTLIAEAGDGPHIPAIPARVMCGKLIGGGVASGARACLGEFSLQEAETALTTLRVSMHRESRLYLPLFAAALGEQFERLPAALRDLHSVVDLRIWKGTAEVARGRGVLSKLAGAIVGFPPSGRDVPVTVTMHRTAGRETWTRDFGGVKFRSTLSAAGPDGSGRIFERFGLLKFTMALAFENGHLRFPVVAGSCLGIPLPGFLLPLSETSEFVIADGRAGFDVSISMPVAGLIAHYRGTLSPADGAAAASSPAAAAQASS